MLLVDVRGPERDKRRTWKEFMHSHWDSLYGTSSSSASAISDSSSQNKWTTITRSNSTRESADRSSSPSQPTATRPLAVFDVAQGSADSSTSTIARLRRKDRGEFGHYGSGNHVFTSLRHAAVLVQTTAAVKVTCWQVIQK